MKVFTSSALLAFIGLLQLGPSAVAAQGGRACGTREPRNEDIARGRVCICFCAAKIIVVSLFWKRVVIPDAQLIVSSFPLLLRVTRPRPEPKPGVVATLQRLAEVPASSFQSAFPVNVDVHFHVINNGEGVDNGNIPQNMIDDQIRVLNEDFKGTGLFNFRLAAVNRTTNATWFRLNPETTEEREMKRTLRKGGPKDLNVYSVNLTGLLGWATFPSDYQSNPTDDGVVIAHSSVPGGSRARFNLGRTLTHEVGHWLGLFHTFQGGCSYPNDGITDTVPQKTSTQGCPTGRKSCTRDDFPRDQQHIFDRADFNVTQDPIHNFMDYSDDSCMNQFTPGQTEKMRSEWTTFREGGQA
ncbi:hypothetical protein HK102_002457 [Quaeritorhiza haematococci]|nr:hypothetical protein HK102_002457 [Quaeritorhiza haematococci]